MVNNHFEPQSHGDIEITKEKNSVTLCLRGEGSFLQYALDQYKKLEVFSKTFLP